MHARKWLSNSDEVLQDIPEEDRATEVDLSGKHLLTIKTLGVLWFAKEDMFSFKANAPDDSKPLTKRYFLSTTAALFDPMGFLAPFVIRAKVLLQDIWMSGIDWDDELTEEQAVKARKWLNKLD